MRAIIGLAATLAFCALSLTPAPAQEFVSACPSGTPEPQRLEGQIWRGVAEMIGEEKGTPSTQLTLEFRADSVVVYTYSDGRRFDNGTWRQNGRVVMFEFNRYFAVNTGTLCGDLLEGDRRNMRGERGHIRFTRVVKGL